jgi:hypothetical protein
MCHVRRIAIASGIIVSLLVLSLALAPGTSESENRQIAAGLLHLHCQWETNADIPSLFESLTNLPFHGGAVGVGKGSVHRRHDVLGIKWEECYFVYQPQPVTDASEWTLYRAWYWYPPKLGKKALATHKLVTIRAN